MRYFVKCKSCRSKWVEDAPKMSDVGKNHHCPKLDDTRGKIGTVNFFGVKFNEYNIFTWYFDVHQLRHKQVSQPTKCGGKCLHAKGHVCDCECGGLNHGAGNLTA